MSIDAMTVFSRSVLVLLPEVVVLLVALGMMTLAAFVSWPRRVWSLVAGAGLVGGIVALYLLRETSTDAIAYASVALNDAFSGYVRLAFLLTGLIVVALGHDQVEDRRSAEFFGAILLVTAGAMLVAASNELVLMFLGLELVSIPTYLLLYLPRRSVATQEAVTKYFYLSVFSSGLFLFGLAYLYGMTGLANLKALAYLLDSFGNSDIGRPPVALGLIAVLFLMAGLGFRVAAVPFHFYAPDVYQGAPTVIAALLAWLPKGVGFVAMIRLLTSVVGGTDELADKAVQLSAVLAVVTLVLGNTVALVQDDLKRLLAYSSIAHAGYLMIGIAVAFRDPAPGVPGAYMGAQSVLFYLAMYALMTLGAFGVLLALDQRERPVETVDDLAGLGRTQPLAALALAFCLFSLAGIPPLAGFWGKFQVFAAALSVGGEDKSLFRLLAVIGVVCAAIGAYYYLRVVVAMYLRAPVGRPAMARGGWPTAVAIGTCASLSLVLGLYPDPINSASREAALAALNKPMPAEPRQPAPPAGRLAGATPAVAAPGVVAAAGR